jgi:hypothetical protein
VVIAAAEQCSAAIVEWTNASVRSTQYQHSTSQSGSLRHDKLQSGSLPCCSVTAFSFPFTDDKTVLLCRSCLI